MVLCHEASLMPKQAAGGNDPSTIFLVVSKQQSQGCGD